MKRLAMFIAFLILILGSPSVSESVTIPALDTGWYEPDGFHHPGNDNYLTGLNSDGKENRSFFVFDMSSIVNQITSATIRVYNVSENDGPGYLSPDPTETLGLWDVTTNITDLLDGLGGVAAFNDLGGGTSYGSQSVSAADNGTFVEVVLNANALTALNVATGKFAIGGALQTIVGPESQYVFGWSHLHPDVELEIEVVPEPGTVFLVGAGLLSLVAIGRRRRD